MRIIGVENKRNMSKIFLGIKSKMILMNERLVQFALSDLLREI